jgi:hypothetical protein
MSTRNWSIPNKLLSLSNNWPKWGYIKDWGWEEEKADEAPASYYWIRTLVEVSTEEDQVWYSEKIALICIIKIKREYIRLPVIACLENEQEVSLRGYYLVPFRII